MFHSCDYHHPRVRLVVGGLLALCVATAGSARAETITVPLPELLGAYSATAIGERFASVTLDVDPAEIVSVSLRAVGTVHVGITSCIPWNGTGWVDYPLRVNINAYVRDPVRDDYLVASFPAPQVDPLPMDTVVPFDRSGAFRSHGGAAWESVAGGPFELDLTALPTTPILDCSWVLVPTTTLTVAELVIELQRGVRVAESAWGAVKALYR